MPDLVDKVMENLRPTSLMLLDEIEMEFMRTRREDECMRRFLGKLYSYEFSRYMREVQRKSDEFLRDCQKYKFLFDVYDAEVAKMKFPKSPITSRRKMERYARQIDDLEKKLNEVMKGHEAQKIFGEVQQLNRETEELETKRKKLTDAVDEYEGFPADIKEAEKCISEMKDRIKKKEAKLE